MNIIYNPFFYSFIYATLFKCKALNQIEPADDGTSTKEDEIGNFSGSSTIKFSAERIVTGMEYLGSGYDIVKANTVGNPNMAEDIGYRAQVIDFTWTQGDIGVTNSLEWLQPIGAWVRPKVSCGETEIASETESASSYKSVSEIDVKVSVNVPNLGSAKAGTTESKNIVDNRMEENKIYKNTYYCFTYSAGMPASFDWKTKREFDEAVNRLHPNYKTFKRCSSALFESKAIECEELLDWIDFFTEFGTHVATEVHLGGRLTRFLKAPKKAIETLNEHGLSVEVAASAVLSGIEGSVKVGTNQKEKQAFDTFTKSSKLEFNVLGGIHTSKTITPESLLKWKASIPKFPMPIKVELIGLDVFLPEYLKEAYKQALQLYIGINKALPWNSESDDGKIFNARTMVCIFVMYFFSWILDSYQVVFTHQDDTSSAANCPNDTRILFGFIIVTNEETKELSISSCPEKAAFCNTPKGLTEEDTTFIWMLCGDSRNVEITQHVMNKDATAKDIHCDDNRLIIAGFALYHSRKQPVFLSRIKSCDIGKSECAKDAQEKLNYSWIACVSESFPEVKVLKAALEMVIPSTHVDAI
ncbi:Membrane attack complex component-perforin (MACPF) domain [Babesia duncani]|uniref:Membrane attack complex component-perforin (MACPF) domain n=1 Tax=Babesia duncani TaxID=323732 RepID=A0AAD9PNW7_9APIC|nr:Membrane attack complex component-perforin (MACPF) domain [Babesia duncani]